MIGIEARRLYSTLHSAVGFVSPADHFLSMKVNQRDCIHYLRI
jgi:hypothetical protein